jgi:hypothetical protein
MVPDVSQWFALDNPVSRVVGAKLFLLAVTMALATDARLRISKRSRGLGEKYLPGHTDVA